MAKHKVVTTDAEIDEYLRDAQSSPSTPEAVGARVFGQPGSAFVQVTMDDGAVHVFPVSKLEGLGSASQEDLARVELNETRDGVSFPSLDLDFFIPHLILGIYGTRQWMATLGRAGGRSRSRAKARAARRNGLKGGRPRRSATRGGEVDLFGFDAGADPAETPPLWCPDYPTAPCSGTLTDFAPSTFAALFGGAPGSCRALPRLING